ncbi:hypothetical protein FF38_06556 [Lucilia cuprina]|uniref:Uncharacterized protein n=1 Tax=Lucilia cuprina TaxID=7375 RepID=A0A0L0C7L9_LUCCU|nr:hypothetical protein FF38_06556 [Lucilia cuprina]
MKKSIRTGNCEPLVLALCTKEFILKMRQCRQKKFKNDSQLQQTMQAEVDKHICKGYARKVSE